MRTVRTHIMEKLACLVVRSMEWTLFCYMNYDVLFAVRVGLALMLCRQWRWFKI